MEKFSLYHFLGLLLPGVLFLYFFNLIINLFGINLYSIHSVNLEKDIIILLCFALIIGAILYTSNFYLVNKTKWFNRFFGMYNHVADLYLNMENLHCLMNNVLNKKAMEWYEKNLFFNQTDFYKLSVSEQNEIKKLQDEYYDRIYYELEYHGKNEQSKAFQSFYFFFRQTVLCCVLLLLIDILLFLYFLFVWIALDAPFLFNFKILWITFTLLLLLIVSVLLARWYRKRMVKKIYWAYFTHLQLTAN